MEELENLLERLFVKDSKKAYEAFRMLADKSRESNAVYPYIDSFIEMMNHENSYVRTRGLLLTAANSKWDEKNRIDEIIDEYVRHITDDKPITARQCIKALPEIVKYKPELKEIIEEALMRADTGRYPDSMSSLVQKDIMETLKIIRTGNF